MYKSAMKTRQGQRTKTKTKQKRTRRARTKKQTRQTKQTGGIGSIGSIGGIGGIGGIGVGNYDSVLGGKKTRKKMKNNNNSKLFVRLSCGPNGGDSKYTCYTNEDLSTLKRMWNERYPDNPIPHPDSDSKSIWEYLKNHYASVCNKESCWIRQMAKQLKNKKMENELMDAFAPESPPEWKKNPNEWLSSLDIMEVMNQYEQKYKCFEFLGPSPIDYDTRKVNNKCVWDELCHFKLSNMIKQGKRKIGVIFNLDPHYKGGSHWVSLFINVNKKTIYYFDSAGEAIPEPIQRFVNTVIKQGQQQSPPIAFRFDQNHPVEHQYGNTECGMYSLYFIVHMLQDKINQDYLKTHILKDKYMQQFRRIYFNPEL